MERLKASAANVDAFIEKAKQYTSIEQLTPEMVRLFIQRIEIEERAVRCSRHSTQQIRIIYRDIGIIDSEILAEEEQPHILPSIDECARKLA